MGSAARGTGPAVPGTGAHNAQGAAPPVSPRCFMRITSHDARGMVWITLLCSFRGYWS